MRLAMPIISGLALMALSAGWARADDVVAGGKNYYNVKVVNFANGTLYVHSGKETLRLPLKDVQKIVLGDDALLKSAEEMFSQHKYDEAIAQYRQARKKATGQWHVALVKARLTQAMAAQAKGPASRPAGAASGPAKGDEPSEPPDALASVDAMAQSLATVPLDPHDTGYWANLEKDEQKDALDQYEKDMAVWKKKHDFHKAKVTWVVKLKAAKADGDAYVVDATSSKGFTVSAEVKTIDKDLLEKLKGEVAIQLAGTVKDYEVKVNKSDSIFNAEFVELGVTLSDATVELAKTKPTLATRPAKQ
jgi:hypothetical protein